MEIYSRYDSTRVLHEVEGHTLRGAYLVNADLRGADLEKANISVADLKGVYLKGAGLKEASFVDTILSGADFRHADLRGADLREAYLVGADLRGANLRGADLREADLREASLKGTMLEEANLRGAKLPHFQIPQECELIVYKKVNEGFIKLLIPKEAKRTASLVGRKCRAEYAVVLEGEGTSIRAGTDFEYKVGETIKPDSYDDDIRVECTNGIHFFLTKEEEENEYYLLG